MSCSTSKTAIPPRASSTSSSPSVALSVSSSPELGSSNKQHLRRRRKGSRQLDQSGLSGRERSDLYLAEICRARPCPKSGDGLDRSATSTRSPFVPRRTAADLLERIGTPPLNRRFGSD